MDWRVAGLRLVPLHFALFFVFFSFFHSFFFLSSTQAKRPEVLMHVVAELDCAGCR